MSGAAPRFIVVVTGLSGAGRSTALRVLEDLSFHCIDNLPTPLLAQAVSLWTPPTGDVRVALGMDVRVGDYLDAADAAVRELRQGGARVHVLFLDASDDALVRRYSETRRPHPLAYLAPGEGLQAHIRSERERLGGLRALADRVIDTTRLTVHDLRRELIAHFAGEIGTSLQMTTRVVSFGFKYGVPVDADNVFDARFLPNPHFVPALRPRTGLDPEVAGFVLESAEGAEYLDAVSGFLVPLLPRYAREGKVTLNIAVGCTGGRHRSVAIAEALGRRLREAGAPGDVRVSHRDADRGG